jgi:hypothetical protein
VLCKRILNYRKGDKQMLINRIKKSYREIVNQVDHIQPIVKVSDIRPAANASSFDLSEMQARRLRRQRRLARASQYVAGGWTVRTW